MNRSPKSIKTTWKRRLTQAAASFIFVGTPACRIPSLTYADAAPNLPDAYPATIGTANPAPAPISPLAAVAGCASCVNANGVLTAVENSGLAGVDEFYKDPNLTQLIAQAMAGNRELKILEQEVVIANNEVTARRGAYLPLIGLGFGGGMEQTSRYTRNGVVENQLEILPGQPFPNPLWNIRLGADINWQIDIWRRLRNARDAAAQRALAAQERRNAFVTRLVADVAENYYALMALDQRMLNLDKTIELQQQSQDLSQARLDQGRGTVLAVQRFQAEVRRNQSEKLIVQQDIIEAENRINILLNRYPEPVPRTTTGFFDLTIHALSVGVPAQLLANRPDIRQAERELTAAGLDVKVARAQFFPQLSISAGVGFEAFDPRFLFRPDALAAAAAGNLVAPLVNRLAIRAEYQSANARQLQSIYNYQRVVLNAFTEVANRMSMAENYRKSVEIRKKQLESLEASVASASQLFQNARAEYVEVLLAQRDLLEARSVLIDTKRQQLTAVVNAYQALGGGTVLSTMPR
jgi:NodT family efflux transporter outer membrane factor (OMF) lipoprotein